MNIKNPSRLGPVIVLVVGILSAVGAIRAGQATEEPSESRFIQRARQLIYDGRRSGEGYFSPDGGKLVFQSEREPGNPFFQIYLLDFETGDTHRVSPGHGKTTCSFIRSKTAEVLFASTHLDPRSVENQKKEIAFRESGKSRRYSWDYDEHFDIFAAEESGRRPRRLTKTRGYDAEGSYSPDGTKIVFCSMRQAYPNENLGPKERSLLEVDPAYFGEIFIMNADGSDQHRLTNWPGYDGGPFFSPDGERIIWRHFEENGAIADIYTMALDGTDVQRLTAFSTMSWAPYFHPSAEYVIFSSNKFGFSNFELFLVDAKGRHEPVRVTTTDRFDGLPVFSPDGNRLCWTTMRSSEKAQLHLAEWNHQAALAALRESPRHDKLTFEVTHHPERASDAKQRVPSSTSSPVTKGKNFDPEIKADELETMVTFLASDKLEGRMTGSEGTRIAADAIAARFRELGLRPIGNGGSYFHEFEFTAGLAVKPENNHLTMLVGDTKVHWVVDKGFRPLAVTSNDEVEGEVVFVGYGLSVPATTKEAYDSYGDLDVSGKIVVALRYVPEGVPLERRLTLNHRAGLRYKAMIARERGAKAFLVVTGPNSPNAGKLAPLTVDSSLSGSGIVAASITGSVAQSILSVADLELGELQSSLDRNETGDGGAFEIPGVRLRIQTSLERVRKTDRNVVAYLPPTNALETDQPLLMIGAHYDHIGHGEAGGSLAGKDEEGMIHNGADDNASGTATVLEIAAKLAHQHASGETIFPVGVVFALWSGEELGLIGSSAFAKNIPFPISRLSAYLNFDMVGRLRDNRLMVQGTGSSPDWRKHLEKRNVLAGFHLAIDDDPYAPTDITSFYPRRIPVLTFFTGSHSDYNRPSDDAKTLNYPGMERIGRFAYKLILDLMRRPTPLPFQEVKSNRPKRGQRENLRAYLGTIPDYTGEGISGVKLSGVGGGGPADEAGLRRGDIIIEFGGKRIVNIYDYTYALEAALVGKPVTVVVMRGEERLSLEVTPRARK